MTRVRNISFLLIGIIVALSLTSCGDDHDCVVIDHSTTTIKLTATIDYAGFDSINTKIDAQNEDTTLYVKFKVPQTYSVYVVSTADGSSYNDTIYENVQVDVFIDDEEVGCITSSPYTLEYELIGLSPGEHSIHADVFTFDVDDGTQTREKDIDESFWVLSPGDIDFEITTSYVVDDGVTAYACLSLNSSEGLEEIYSVEYYWDGEMIAETDSYETQITLPSADPGHTLKAVVLLKVKESDTTLYYFTVTRP